MTILQIVSCRGWSSDAYWAARATVELERAGHDVTLVCKRRSEARVIRRARDAGVSRIETLTLTSGIGPVADVRDLRRLVAWLPGAQVLHVHRGKEHWLAALANRMSSLRRPLVRTRHIVQPVRPHALNRWLYGRATDQVVTVTEAIRRQLVAGGLGVERRVVTMPGGVDVDRFRPGAGAPPDHGIRAALGLPHTEAELAVIRVCDRGVGIPREMLGKVFELFAQVDRTVDRSEGGLGLGLAIARNIVQLHGGTVSASSGTRTSSIPMRFTRPGASWIFSCRRTRPSAS